MEVSMYDSALQRANNYLQNDPDNVFLKSNYIAIKARVLLKKNQAPDALKLVNTPLEYSEYDAYLNETKGLVFQALGKKDSALHYFKEAVLIKMTDGSTRLNSYQFMKSPFIKDAYLQTPKLGGYDLSTPDDLGTRCLAIAAQIGSHEAYDILVNKSPFKQQKPAAPVKTKK